MGSKDHRPVKNGCNVLVPCWFYLSTYKKSVVLVIVGLLCLLLLYEVLDHTHYNYVTSPTPLILQPMNERADHFSARASTGRDYAERFGRMRYKHTKRRLPDCIVIGARKAGTRALLTYLDLHPHVRTAKNEVHFFDDEDNYRMGLEWYRKKMPYTFDGDLTIEKTPAYFVCDYVPERIYAMNASIKLLLVVRDPVDRAVSDYLQILDNKIRKRKPYEDFETLAIDQISGEVRKDYPAIKRSIYYRHMRPWLEYFPLSQILVVSAEQLVSQPFPVMQRVEKFLQLEPRIKEDMFYYNATRHFYCVRNRTENKCLAASKGRVHPHLNPLVRQKLDAFFQGWNQKFYHMVQQDFGWPTV